MSLPKKFCRSLPWVVFAVLVLLFQPHFSLAKGEKPKTLKRMGPVKESLFLLYALEDLYRAPLPDKFLGNGASIWVQAEEFEAFVARQQVTYDQLAVYLSKQKNRDPEMVALFDDYGKRLQEIQGLVKEVQDCQKKHLAPLCETLLKLRYEEMRQANAVLMAGLYQGFAAFSRGESDDMSFKRGMSAAMARAIKAQELIGAARNAAQDKLKQAKLDLEEELNSFFPEKKEELKKKLQEGPPLSQELLLRLGKKYGWRKEVDLTLGRKLEEWGDGQPPDNPLWIERIVLSRKPPEGLARIEFYLRNARELLVAARMVPSPIKMRKAFDSYKIRLYWEAGQMANYSAAVQIGTAGFKSASADASKTAIEAWNSYALLTPIPLNDSELRHQYILSFAYGGKKEKARAYYLVKIALKQMNVEPARVRVGLVRAQWLHQGFRNNFAFWYDAARICSLAQDIPSAMACYYQAVRAGFRKAEAARVDPDLTYLRAGAPQQFDNALSPPKKEGK